MNLRSLLLKQTLQKFMLLALMHQRVVKSLFIGIYTACCLCLINIFIRIVNQLYIRVKKTGSFGGYKVITENNQSVKSREELLEMRSKKKSDRYNSLSIYDILYLFFLQTFFSLFMSHIIISLSNLYINFLMNQQIL